MKKKKLFASLAGVLSLWLVVGSLYLYTCLVFYPKNAQDYGGSFYKERGFKGETDNTLDALIIGNSNSKNCFNPLEMYMDQGIRVFNNGIDGQNIQSASKLFSIACKTQKYKVLMIEPDMLFQNENLTKYIYKGEEEDLFFKAPYLNHGKWGTLTYKDFFKTLDSTPYRTVYKGFNLCTTDLGFLGTVGLTYDDTVTPKTIPEERKKTLDATVQLAKDNGMNILFVSTPITKPKSEIHKAVLNLCQEYSASYLDFNEKTVLDSIGFVAKEDFEKLYHTNYKGSIKVSKYLAKYLKSNYNLTDYSNTEIGKTWDKDVEKYTQDLKNLNYSRV